MKKSKYVKHFMQLKLSYKLKIGNYTSKIYYENIMINKAEIFYRYTSDKEKEAKYTAINLRKTARKEKKTKEL